MLEQLPEYKALPQQEQWQLLRRVMKVYSQYRHPERDGKVREEVNKIIAELRAKKPKE